MPKNKGWMFNKVEPKNVYNFFKIKLNNFLQKFNATVSSTSQPTFVLHSPMLRLFVKFVFPEKIYLLQFRIQITPGLKNLIRKSLFTLQLVEEFTKLIQNFSHKSFHFFSFSFSFLNTLC